MLTLKDTKSLIILLALTFLLYVPTLSYPETGDSEAYATLAKSLAEGNGYAIEGVPHAQRLPMLPVLSAPIGLIAGSYMFSIRLTALILGIVSIVTWFYIGKKLFNETKFFPLLFLSPLLVEYSIFRGLSEAPLICFSLLSILFFLKSEEDPKFYYLSGIFFGLASLSRFSGITLGMSYILLFIIEKRRFNRHFVIGLLAGVLVFSTFFFRNYLVFGDFFYSPYIAKITGKAAGEPMYMRLSRVPVFAPALLMIAGPFFIPLFFKGIKRRNMLFMILIVLNIFFASLSGPRYRYLAPVIPFVLIVVFDGFKSSDEFKKLLFIGIIANVLVTPYFINGHVKDFTDSIYPSPPRWGQLGLANEKAVDWINDNLPENAIIVTRHDRVWSEYLRDDLIMLNYGELRGIESGELFILYDHVLINLEKRGDFEIKTYIDKNYELTKVFEKGPLTIIVYKLTPK